MHKALVKLTGNMDAKKRLEIFNYEKENQHQQ